MPVRSGRAGREAGQKVFTVQGAMSRNACFTQALCADEQGFNLHAAVRCDADELSGSSSCASTSRARRWPTNACSATLPGRWYFKLKTAWRDGTTPTS